MLGVEQIRLKVGSTSYQRGVEYFESGAVAELQQRDSTVLAKCKGSRAEPYSLWAAIKSRNGKLLLGEAFCSCPVGNEGTCKHVVAMLLTWRESPLSQQLLARHHSDVHASPSSSPFIARHHRISTAAVSLTPPGKRENNSFSKSRERQRHSMPTSFRFSESSNRQANKRRGNSIIALKDEDRTTLRCNALGITRYSSVSPIQRTSNKRKRVEFQKEEEAVGRFYEDDAGSYDTLNEEEEEEEGESMERIPRPPKRRPKTEESENDRWPSSSARSDLVAFLKGQNQKLKDTMAALEEQLESQIDLNERLTKKLRKRESYIRRLEQHMDKLYARLGVSDYEPQKLKEEEKMDVVKASRAQEEREIDEEREEEDTQGMDLTELVKLPSASSLTPSLFKDETPQPNDDKPTNAEQPQREHGLEANKEPTQTKDEEKQESENSDLFCNLFFFRPKSTPTTSNATISTTVNTTDSSSLSSTSRSPSSPLLHTTSSACLSSSSLSSFSSSSSSSSSASLSSSSLSSSSSSCSSASSSSSSSSPSFPSSSSCSSPSAPAAACSSSSSSSSSSPSFPSSSSPRSFSSSFPFFSLRTEDIGNEKHDEEEQPTSHPTVPPPIKADDDSTVIIKKDQEEPHQQQELPQRQERSLRELMEMHFSPQKDKQATASPSSSSLAPTFHDIFFGGR